MGTSVKKVAKRAKRFVFSLRYVAAVEEGVKFLDLVMGRKKWLQKMDMGNFHIDRPSVCVAGNVFQDVMFEGSHSGYESFKAAISAIGGGGNDAAIRFGFNAPSDRGLQQLQDLWVRKITLLKKQVAK